MQTPYLRVPTGGAGAGDLGIFIGSSDLDGTLYVQGQINADIDVADGLPVGATLDIPSIPSGRTVSFGGDAAGSIEPLGSLAGTLSIGGRLDTDITVAGDLTGSILTGEGLGGFMSIDGDV